MTLKQISDDTGFSIATVSRTLNRKIKNHSVNEEKIYASARRLGYPFLANADESGQVTIALVMKLFEGEFYSSLINGFYEASGNTDSEIVFSYVV